MKRLAAVLLLVLCTLMVSGALAYTDPTSVTTLPYSGSFNIKQSVFTAYCFYPGGSSLTVGMSNVKMEISKSATLKVNSYYYTSGGSWASAGSGSVGVSGTASSPTLIIGAKSGYKNCVRFSKSDYLDYKVSGNFTIQ